MGSPAIPHLTSRSIEAIAALNRTNINIQLLTLEAARTHLKEDVYLAVMMDPHTQSELSIDDIVAMCDDLIEAHGAQRYRDR